MKYLKIMGLAAVAAMALMAFGAGSASAVTLCKEAKSPCPEASRYTSGTAITASLKTKTVATLTSSLGNVVCTESAVSGKTTATSGSPLPGTISSLSFKSCTLGSSSCTVTVENLPYAASVDASATVGNGTLTTTGQAHVDCGSALNCIFKKAVALSVTGGNPALVTANTALELIKNEGFICPSSATWDAEYEVTAPKPLFVVASP